jgi:threonine dehydrogenase-like Zn-dependent dehydrogenase
MPAVVLTAERTIAFQERPRPSLRTDQVIVEVELCGICGSDLHAALMAAFPSHLRAIPPEAGS